MKDDRKKKKLTGVRVTSLWWNHNDQNKHNSVLATQAFIEKAVSKAVAEGFDNLRVMPGCREGDENNLESYFLYVIGDRMETDQEFKDRMRHEFIRERERGKSAKMTYDYFQTPAAKADLEELERLSKGE